MLTYRTGAAGGGGKAMAEYLAAADVPELSQALSASLGSTLPSADFGRTAAMPRLDMHPLIAGLLRIDPHEALSIQDMSQLLAGHRTDGGAIDGKRLFRSSEQKTRIAYTDFTFSAPKSFSLALVMAPTAAERAILEECWIKANDALMSHVASQIGVILDKDGQVIDRGHVAIIRYDHYTSRPTIKLPDGPNDTQILQVPTHIPGDMQRHTHNVLPNVLITDEGKVRALPLQEMRERLHEWGAIGHAYLATYLREQGIRIGIDEKTGLSQLLDVPQWACELFQNRSNDGERAARKYAAEQGIDWYKLDPSAKSKMLTNRLAATRREKDGAADLASWITTAEKAGYQHHSVIRPNERQGLPDKPEQISTAYHAALPMLEDQFSRRSRLTGSVVRTMAARGLITTGIETPRDVDLVTATFRRDGIRQDGRMSALVWGKEQDQRYASVTTELHEDHEKEAIDLLKAAAADKSGALSKDQIERAIGRVSAARGYEFESPHGRAQAEMATAFATAGRAIVGIGAAGSGKSISLEPVIDAYHAAGWESYGVTLAWRQTHALEEAGVGKKKRGFSLIPDADRLTDAGIQEGRTFALQPFLRKARGGEIALNDKTLVVMDEIATVGTRQILELARLQAEHGFKLVGIGDDRQAKAVEAGNSINLFRRAFGEEQIPQLLETVRQQRIDDREIATLFREGKALEALQRKNEAGLLKVVPGGYSDAVKAGVDEWQARSAANENRDGYRIGISVPTNADAHAVGLEIRQRLREAGRLAGSDHRIMAQDQRGEHYDMDIAVGDTVRLFNRVNATAGPGSRGYFGENGTTAEIVAIDVARGLRLKRQDGRIGDVSWVSLLDKETGRVRLAYGTALTIDSRQGDTLTDHITILPNGSKAIDAFKIYPADTRNRENSVIVVSHGAEKEELIRRQVPSNEQTMIENMARNLSRQQEKRLALDFIESGMQVFRGSVGGLQSAWHRSVEAANENRQSDLAGRFDSAKMEGLIVSLLEAFKQSTVVTRFMELLAHEGGGFPRDRPRLSDQEIQLQYADVLRAAGFVLDGLPIMDGQWHRAWIDENGKRSRDGSYVGYLDGRPAGSYINFKVDSKARKWVSEAPGEHLQPVDREKLAEARVAREVAREKRESDAALKAKEMWVRAKPAREHDYLKQKGIDAHGARVDRAGNLLIAMQATRGPMMNVQMIRPDGQKLYLKDAKKTGMFYTIGIPTPTSPLIIAEGFATGATIYEATRMPVVVAFDAANLLPVAQALHSDWPARQLIFAADNDHHLPRQEKPLENVGLLKAAAAASQVGGVVIAPDFKGGEKGSDFNDVGAIIGKKALRELIAAKLKEKGVEMPDGDGAERKISEADREYARQSYRRTAHQNGRDGGERARDETFVAKVMRERDGARR